MRAIEFHPPEHDDQWNEWQRDCQEETARLQRAVEDGQRVEIKESLYKRRDIWRRYYHDPNSDEPQGPFFGKCVYCERRKRILHAEHFRPKQGVRDRDNRPVERLADDTAHRHPGYYWLAYHWQNLLPACDDCNIVVGNPRDGYIGKGERFPLADEAERAWSPEDDLSAERPLLINPVLEDPREHIEIDLTTGLLFGRTARGRACIELQGLNRGGLPEQRRSTIAHQDQLWHQATSRNSSERQRSQASEDLCQHKAGRHEFTLTARTCIEAHQRHQRSLQQTLDCIKEKR